MIADVATSASLQKLTPMLHASRFQPLQEFNQTTKQVKYRTHLPIDEK
jgi:hypothetical protein